jgi:hypothetical protein
MATKKKKNPYEAKADHAASQNSITHRTETRGNLKNAGLETAKELIGIVVGGFAGAALGKPSLYVGAGLTALGHYSGTQPLTLLGVGMMAANGFQKSNSVEGLDGLDMQSVKKRVQAYKENFLEKTYIDKVLHHHTAATTKDSTSGIDGYQFFNYPDDSEAVGEFEELDKFQKQLQESGLRHMRDNNITEASDIRGIEDGEDMEGIGDWGEDMEGTGGIQGTGGIEGMKGTENQEDMDGLLDARDYNF